MVREEIQKDDDFEQGSFSNKSSGLEPNQVKYVTFCRLLFEHHVMNCLLRSGNPDLTEDIVEIVSGYTSMPILTPNKNEALKIKSIVDLLSVTLEANKGHVEEQSDPKVRAEPEAPLVLSLLSGKPVRLVVMQVLAEGELLVTLHADTIRGQQDLAEAVHPFERP